MNQSLLYNFISQHSNIGSKLSVNTSGFGSLIDFIEKVDSIADGIVSTQNLLSLGDGGEKGKKAAKQTRPDLVPQIIVFGPA